MQYTGKSFTKSLAKLFSYFTAEKKEYHEIESAAIFPLPAAINRTIANFWEQGLLTRQGE